MTFCRRVSGSQTFRNIVVIPTSASSNLLGYLTLKDDDATTLRYIRDYTPNYKMSHPRRINPLKPELNSICYLLALLAHHFLHVSRIRVKSLTFRRLMSYIYIYIYIYGAPILDVSRSHTTTQHSR